jgi:hypothetical protein
MEVRAMNHATGIVRQQPVRPLPVARQTPAEVRAEPPELWNDETRYEWIAENAYYRAERRGFLPGYETDDWLAAERDFEAHLLEP